ncbi:hypothetical protein Tco_0773274 [Tanacetum coccineum]|uniref:Integrase, catalytic region, zinc finger, CCHC-type, peptidase aspartic, catalytic n=1 Tax=Tanacetum coccineum TaxID=301880 RepID=A0ABQ4ZPB5_9ASTR
MFHHPLILLQIVQLILFIVESGCTKHMTGNLKLLCNFIEKYLGTFHFGNDQFAPILGYEDLFKEHHDNMVYYIRRPQPQSLTVGQFCDADLEVAFWKSTCFVRDLQGNDLLTGNYRSDLYTISLQEITPICFTAKASPTQACKAKKRSSFKTKVVPSSKGRLNFLHMDLYGPMRVESLNGKKYIMAEAIATACYTQNRSIIIPTHEKTANHISMTENIQLMRKLHITSSMTGNLQLDTFASLTKDKET